MIGSTIGNYSIERKIGEGGMGAVFKGRDLMLDREVAIKSLRPELARMPDLVNRFVEEAKTLARLNQSHIATLYSFHRQGDDFFMVMEFVPGRTLHDVLTTSGALDTVEAVRLFCETLEAIAHAHSFGIIHRDIKPANVMLTRTGEVKVMDFGIARVLGTARQTKTGRLIGTLEYMSPEQMRGQETDSRSDIYSLGILLYEMLTGRVPFDSQSDYELMRAQVEETPLSPRELKTDIPQAVEEAVLRALAKAPQARFQTAHEFRAALISAVPAAALKPETVSSFVTAPLKETRMAVSRDDSLLSEAGSSFTDQIKATALSPSAAVRASATQDRALLASALFTARHAAQGLFAGLNWKHYSATATTLALGAGLMIFTGRRESPKPVTPAQQEPSIITPAPQPVVEALPVQQATPTAQPAEPVKSERARNIKRERPSTPNRSVAYTTSAPAASVPVATPRVIVAPTPTPTPAVAKSEPKKEGMFGRIGGIVRGGAGLAKDVKEGFIDPFKKNDNGRNQQRDNRRRN